MQSPWSVQESHNIKDPGSPEMVPNPTYAKEIGLACMCGDEVGVYGEAEHLGEGTDNLDLWGKAHDVGVGRGVGNLQSPFHKVRAKGRQREADG